jgi:hypothetical protein
MSKAKSRQANKPLPPQHWTAGPDPEDLDLTPVEMPLGACRPEPLEQIISRMVRAAVEEERGEEFETPEEAEDFEEEDPEVLGLSPYELVDMKPEPDVPQATISPDPVPDDAFTQDRPAEGNSEPLSANEEDRQESSDG